MFKSFPQAVISSSMLICLKSFTISDCGSVFCFLLILRRHRVHRLVTVEKENQGSNWLTHTYLRSSCQSSVCVCVCMFLCPHIVSFSAIWPSFYFGSGTMYIISTDGLFLTIVVAVYVLLCTGCSKKKRYPCFIFCDNFRKWTPILTIFSLLEPDIYDA